LKKVSSVKKLKLIHGGLRSDLVLGRIRVAVATEGSRPFQVDAVVFEEDTWLVMSADPKICQPEKHPIRLMTELLEATPEIPGSVFIRPGRPMRFLAIVHDFNREPSWREEWIEDVLCEIFRESERRKMTAIGMPLLCTKHGRLGRDRFLFMLTNVIDKTSFEYLKRLWLIVPSEDNTGLINDLEKQWRRIQMEHQNI
jgi:hypothetical protein